MYASDGFAGCSPVPALPLAWALGLGRLGMYTLAALSFDHTKEPVWSFTLTSNLILKLFSIFVMLGFKTKVIFVMGFPGPNNTGSDT